MDIEQILKNIPFFDKLDESALKELAVIGVPRSFDAGQIVFLGGDNADALYVILKGAARVFSRDKEGTEVEISHLKEGDFFGEIALLDGQPRSASVSSLTTSIFFTIGREEFFELLLRSKPLVSQLLASLSSRIRGSNMKYCWEVYKEQRVRAEMEVKRHRAISEMVAGVAHEINTPLGIINLAASLVEDNLKEIDLNKLGLDDETIESLEDIHEAVGLMQTNITRADNLIKTFKSLSVTQVADQQETVDLLSLVDETVDLYRIQTKQVHFKTEIIQNIPPGDSRKWDGYPGYFSQILLGLFSNVERYAYPTGEKGKIEITISLVEKRFTVAVKDFGQGIPSKHLNKIFNVFFTTGQAQGSSGLGLAIVHNLVTSALQGNISVESEYGKGATFKFDFPKVIV